ncbi:hypothetical protein FHS29_004670 [Saccharothrix tamanrassetensis]|uniref:Uncharacterized protein n=1 Tax=Saccharothrix tamanrassetensis TaxID=1051531 RepID=A0A841CHP7_9PSEU|nr:hypothetical protein [Saccharothrix tamanrassetensis]MBB5958062.1 hypothetical protein [Saccharothrix tamanrassetensis]
MTALDIRATRPASVLAATVGIGVHAFNHVTVVVQDVWRLIATPEAAGFNPGTVYHPISAVLYVWLATTVHSGRNAGRIAITVLLAFQAVGRYFVFVSYPEVEVRADLVTGWALSAVVLFLLWFPVESRRHFAAPAA